MTARPRWQSILVLALLVAAARPAWAGRRCRPRLAAPERARLVLDYPLAMPPDRTPENRVRIGTAVLSPGGRYLVLGTDTGHVIAWDLAAGRLLGSRPGHQQPVKRVAFGETDRFALTGADDLQVVLWDLKTFEPACSFPGAPLRALYEIALSPDGRHGLSRGFDGFGTVWDLREDRELMSLFSYAFAFHPDGRSFVTAPRRLPGASLFRLKDQRETELATGEAPVHRVAFDPAGRLVAGVAHEWDEPSRILLWDARTGRRLRALDLSRPNPGDEPDSPVYVHAFCFSADSTSLLVACSDRLLRLIDVGSGELRRVWRFPGRADVWDVRWVGHDRFLVHATEDDPAAETFRPTTALWDTRHSEPRWHRAGHISVDRRCRLGAATADGDLLLLDAATGAALLRLRAFQEGRRWIRVDAATGSCSAGSGCETADCSRSSSGRTGYRRGLGSTGWWSSSSAAPAARGWSPGYCPAE